MIDTHTHLFSAKFKSDWPEVVDRAITSGVTECLLPNIDVASVPAMLEVCDAYPDVCKPMLGLHPTSVGAEFDRELDTLEAKLNDRAWVAIGEIGTDLYWSREFWPQQQEAFVRQCGWAIDKHLPVSVHCRDSIDETIALIEPLCKRGLRGVIHCFTGSVKQAKRCVDLGFYLGIGGILPYKNRGELGDVVRSVPHEFLLLETDSPYLSPVPRRGRRNESSYLPHVAKVLAEDLALTAEQVDELTTRNARALFG